MQEEDLEKFHEWYRKTIDDLSIDDEDIMQYIIGKKAHTPRVYENIQQIGQALGLNPNDFRLAETIALFHDVGRFYQYLEYKTLMDFTEPMKNHAELGIDILENSQILDIISNEEKNVVLKAIKYHNAYKLPKEEDERVLFFSKLIRDADKLDIYKMHVKYIEEKSEYHKPILKKFPDVPEYTMQNIHDILNNEVPENDNMKTYNDLKLVYISWIFDINFDFTIKRIADNKYMERLIANLPDNEDIKKVNKHVKDYINKRLKSKEEEFQ